MSTVIAMGLPLAATGRDYVPGIGSGCARLISNKNFNVL